jgi:phosphohistidine phosphatase
MNLYLMRHAIAADASPNMSDSQRPLTEKGRKKLAVIARNLEKIGLTFDLILTSPYLRTRQTAEMVAEVFKIKPDSIIVNPNITPDGSAENLIEEINAGKPVENLLIVSHEPFISELIGILVAGDPNIGIGMKKAGICKLSIQTLHYGRCATLEWLMPPSLMLED